jgi:hypothetical protein
VPEGVVDGGQVVDSGHESSPSGRRRRRPDGVPDGFVYDRQTREWRMPRKPGPKSEDASSQSGSDDGWQADRDPDPAHLSSDDDRRGRDDDDGSGELPQETLDEVTGLLALLALPIGAVAERRDPYCGAVFAQQLPAIVEAAAPIVCRSETVLRWMNAKTGGLMDWVGLAMALAPVGRAVADHHILKVVEIVDEDQAQGAAAA